MHSRSLGIASNPRMADGHLLNYVLMSDHMSVDVVPSFADSPPVPRDRPPTAINDPV
ncbi:hypothetical protein CGRA01v4_07536 [Colletotrichum graminicola]|nr:hypothetical protein CGRA01v4_07536 [Colletotrichum graminicola]